MMAFASCYSGSCLLFTTALAFCLDSPFPKCPDRLRTVSHPASDSLHIQYLSDVSCKERAE
ncbi:hypothetical protein QC762_117752 [Podospora pseudocomata]|uniref:Secreted protein n=1 Tax=Podospora pseudocomata TaxID=2093779 RepID=A0ABR0GXB1_9PEZI|nr:hypothetical protein QC762_117752 [Podospora pseudocomata]